MKIAIAGTRGIPNRYGGFEKFAEMFAPELCKRGYDVTVYNPSFHQYKEDKYKDVRIIRKKCPVAIMGGIAHFYYDYLCLKDAIRNNFDVVIMCGYGTSSFAVKFLKKKGSTQVIVNMDGMEWKRKKYSWLTKQLLKWSERQVVKNADLLVADHPEIKVYYEKQYNVIPKYISYGADVPDAFNNQIPDKYGLEPWKYFITVARDDPDNQVMEIVDAWENSKIDTTLVIVTNNELSLKSLMTRNNIKILSGIYDYEVLSSLRHFSIAQIHGHKAGGTNPSLLEAMACFAPIIAHDNVYNRFVLNNNALYFRTVEELATVFRDFREVPEEWLDNNIIRINEDYTWGKVADKYVSLL